MTTIQRNFTSQSQILLHNDDKILLNNPRWNQRWWENIKL